MITLDGAHEEGGGSIVRIALALSTLTHKPFSITNIRKNRPQPGLKNQHLYCITALQKLCDAKTENVHLGSTSLTYHPGTIKGKTISIDIETAGSITLFLQAVLLPSLFADKKVRVKVRGGTDVKWATPADFFTHIIAPHVKRFGEVKLTLLQRGYYPKGGGKLEVTITPQHKTTHKQYALVDQGKLLYIKGISHASSTLAEARVAERQAKAATIPLHKYNVPVNIQTEYSESLSPGSGITLWAIFSTTEEVDVFNPVILGADALGEKTKRAETVGQEAAQKLIQEIESDACVDRHTADQLLPLLALAGGTIKTSEITKHTRSNIHVIEQFLDVKFNVDEEKKIISVER